MKNYWIQLSRRAKESEKIRFNYLMQKIAEGGGGGGGSEWAERIAAIEEKIFLIKQDISSLTSRMTNAENKNTEQDTNITSIKEKEDLLELKVAYFTEKVDDLVTKVSDHEGLLSTLSESVTTLTTKVSGFESQITTFTEKIATFEEELGSWSSRITTAEQKIAAFEEELGSWSSRITTAEQKIAAFEEEISSWAERITTAEGKIAAFEDKITTFTEKIENFEVTLTSFTQRLNDLESLVNTFDGKITTLTSQVTEFTTTFQEKISTLTTQVTEMGSTVETFDNRIIGLDVKVKALEDRFGYTTTVYVVDSETGMRIPGAAVHLSGHILTDDGEGKYEIVDLPPASYHLTVSAEGYSPYEEEITVNKQYCDFDVRLNKCYKIYGVVTSTRGDPVRNAMVLPMERSERVTYTDGEGKYEITELENGDYTIMTQKEGFATQTDYATVFNEDVELDIFLVED